MQLNRVQGTNQVFNGLYIGQKLSSKILYKPTTEKFLSDFAIIKNNIIANKLDNKKFVDILLDENNDKFFAVISSKEQGIPMNPGNQLTIEATKKGFLKFKKWVNEWNHAYNPKTLEEFKRLDKLIRTADWRNTSLDKSLKELQ